MEQELAKYWIEFRREKRNPDRWPPDWDDIGLVNRKYFMSRDDRNAVVMQERLKTGVTPAHGNIK